MGRTMGSKVGERREPLQITLPPEAMERLRKGADILFLPVSVYAASLLTRTIMGAKECTTDEKTSQP